jgi:hypothetical protein
MNFRTMQAANRRKTIGLLMGMGVLMWVVVYAALTYFGGSGAALFLSQLVSHLFQCGVRTTDQTN